jgi:acetyl esterase/lipase
MRPSRSSRLVCLFSIFALPFVGLPNAFTVETYTFKTVGTNQLKADVHRSAGDVVRPVIVFIHGGALMMGSRRIAPSAGSLLEAMLNAGYAVVSIDYRLAPQVKLPAIIEDVVDACAWVRREGPKRFAMKGDELFVMGESAGGYLTLMSGWRLHPRPRALVSFWGYGDIAGSWYSKPDAFYRQKQLVTKEETEKSGALLYLYCRQQGFWPKVLTGHDPETDPRAFDPFSPVRNVTPEYPPTMLIHGTKDTDVPYEQSVQMDKELTARGVAQELLTIPEGGHGFDRRQPEIAARAYQQVVSS